MKQILTVLSVGVGQDSSAIMEMLIRDPAFRAKYAPSDLMLIFADTLNEHPETYRWLKQLKHKAHYHNIPFAHLMPEDWATGDWKGGLVGFYKAGNRIGSKSFPKTCTDKLKIQPIYKYLEAYIHQHYGTEKVGRKRAIKEFVDAGNEIRVLIGFAKGEEKRVADPINFPKWQQRITRQYPLIDIGFDRADCQNYLMDTISYCPPPSNCMVCPFMDKKELLLLYYDYNEDYQDWVEMEANKIRANTHADRNLGVFGEKLLPETLKDAQTQYAASSVDELRRHRFSHGHCVNSKY